MAQNQEELEQRIAAYVDGQLSPAEAARLEVFLANTDPALADRIVGMLADRVQIKSMPRPAAPADLSARIMEQIERGSLLQDHEPAAQPRWWQSRAAIAASVALVLGSLGYFVATSVLRPDPNAPWTPQQGARAPLGETGTRAVAFDDSTKGGRREEGLSKAGASDLDAGATRMEKGAGPTLAMGPTPTPAIAPNAAAQFAQTASNDIQDAAKPGEHGDGVTQAAPTTIASAGGTGMPNQELLTPRAAPGGPVGGGGAGGGAGGFGGGGGGGGGRAAGGRGGRGGAGAATPAAPAVSQQPAANADTAVANNENAQRAMTMVSRELAGPIVMTFYAKDDQDYARLALALAAYSNSNAQLAARGAQGQFANGGDVQTDGRNSTRQQQSNNFQNLSPAPNNNNNDFATASQAGNITLNNSGVIIFNNGRLGANGGVQSGIYSDQNQVQASSQPGGPPNVGGNTLMQQNVQNTAVRGGPYRIALRAEQLDELARNYRVAVLARGSTVYTFGIVGDKAPSTADARQRLDLIRKANLDDEARDGQRSQIAQATTAPTSVAAAPAAAIGSRPNQGAADAGPLNANATMGNNGIAVINNLSNPSATIECVITMEPAPSATPASAPARQ